MRIEKHKSKTVAPGGQYFPNHNKDFSKMSSL